MGTRPLPRVNLKLLAGHETGPPDMRGTFGIHAWKKAGGDPPLPRKIKYIFEGVMIQITHIFDSVTFSPASPEVLT